MYPAQEFLLIMFQKKIIQKCIAIKEISQGHTSLVIAHRLSTIVDADKIVVMGQGKILEQGSHSQLLAINGAYKKLWDTQQNNHDSETKIG